MRRRIAETALATSILCCISHAMNNTTPDPQDSQNSEWSLFFLTKGCTPPIRPVLEEHHSLVLGSTWAHFQLLQLRIDSVLCWTHPRNAKYPQFHLLQWELEGSAVFNILWGQALKTVWAFSVPSRPKFSKAFGLRLNCKHVNGPPDFNMTILMLKVKHMPKCCAEFGPKTTVFNFYTSSQ